MKHLEDIVCNLNRRGFKACLVPDASSACERALEIIGGGSVGIGGSLSVEQTGLYERLVANGNKVFWHWKDKAPDVTVKASLAPVYLTSANAISEDGYLVNIDGRGNRVSASVCSKEAVYIVAGVNKLAPDLEKAIWRARNVAAPKNAQRLGRNTPCAKNGDKCYDCNSPECICSVMSIVRRPMMGMGKYEVILIDQDLGM